MINVLVVGPFEGPKGGINIHINRLFVILNKEYGLNIIRVNDGKGYNENITNIRKFQIFSFLKVLFKCEVVHIHTSVWWMMLFYIFISKLFLKKVFVTIHSFGYKNYQKQILRIFLNKCNKVISVSKSIASQLKLKKEPIIQHAFIPPIESDEPFLPSKIKSLISNKKGDGTKIFVANAWQLFTYNNEDLYGMDLCIKVAEYAKNELNNLFIIFVISSPNAMAFKYDRIIKSKKLENYIYIHFGSLSFIRLIQVSDAVLRPTNKDGDALTVREALHYNKLVIASDVVARPEGTIIFENRNAKSLYRAMTNIAKSSNKSSFLRDEKDYVNLYKKIYTECNNSHKN